MGLCSTPHTDLAASSSSLHTLARVHTGPLGINYTQKVREDCVLREEGEEPLVRPGRPVSLHLK